MIEGASCIECGGPLQIEQFTDAWDKDDKPCDVFEDPYCPACKLRWMAMEQKPDEEAEG